MKNEGGKNRTIFKLTIAFLILTFIGVFFLIFGMSAFKDPK